MTFTSPKWAMSCSKTEYDSIRLRRCPACSNPATSWVTETASDSRVEMRIGEIQATIPAIASPNLPRIAAQPVETLIFRLSHEIRDGVIIVSTKNAVYAFVPPFSGSTLYWINRGGDIILTTNPVSLAGSENIAFSEEYLSAMLVESLPETVLSDESPWADIRKVPAIHLVRFDTRFESTYEKIQILSHSETDADQLSEKLREQFFTVMEETTTGTSQITADLSGGIDSAVNAYLLKKTKKPFSLYHIEPDSQFNDDTQWAHWIADDLGMTFTSMGTMRSQSRTFDIDKAYPNNALPDRPLFWSDTEGYLAALSEHNQSEESLHFTGLGGDELFSSLPAHFWSMVREQPRLLPNMAHRYATNTRTTFLNGIRKLLDHTDYQQSVTNALRHQEQNSSQFEQTLDWIGEISIPEFLSSEAHAKITDVTSRGLSGQIEPFDSDRSRHQAISSLLMQTRIMRQANILFQLDHMSFASPYLDPEIIDYALSFPVSRRAIKGLHKGALYKCLEGIVPLGLFTRPVKGEYSVSLYDSWDAAKSKLINGLSTGLLASMNLLDVDKLRKEASLPMSDSRLLFSLERVAAVERWLRNVQ